MSFPLSVQLENFEDALKEQKSDILATKLAQASWTSESQLIAKLDRAAKSVAKTSLLQSDALGLIYQCLCKYRESGVVSSVARSVEKVLCSRISELINSTLDSAPPSEEKTTEMNVLLFLLVNYVRIEESAMEAKYIKLKGAQAEAIASEWAAPKLRLLQFLHNEVQLRLLSFYGAGFLERKAQEFVLSVAIDCSSNKWNLKGQPARLLCIDEICVALVEMLAYPLVNGSGAVANATLRVLSQLLIQQPLLKEVLLPLCIAILEQPNGVLRILGLITRLVAMLFEPSTQSSKKETTGSDPRGQTIMQFLLELAEEDSSLIYPFLQDLQAVTWQCKSVVRRLYIDLLGVTVKLSQQNFNPTISEYFFSRLKDKDYLVRSKTVDQFMQLYDFQPSSIDLFPIIFSAIMSRTSDRVKKVRLHAYKAVSALLQNNPYGRSLLPRVAKDRLDQLQKEEQRDEEAIKKAAAADHFVRGVVYGKLLPQLYRTLLRRAETEDYCEEEVREIGGILSLKIDGAVALMHDWQRLLDALVHTNPAVESALATILSARLSGSASEDLQYLIRITKSLPDTHMELLTRLTPKISGDLSSVLGRAVTALAKAHELEAETHSSLMKVIWLLQSARSDESTDAVPLAALSRYLHLVTQPDTECPLGARYCLKSLARYASDHSGVELSSSLPAATLFSAARGGCVDEVLELVAKLPQPKQRMLAICHHLETNLSTSSDENAMVLFMKAISRALALLGTEIDTYWDEQFNSQLGTTSGEKAATEDYLTSARTREEVLRLAAQEKAELLSSEESYFSRFGPFLLAIVLEQDAPTAVRTTAAEAMSALLKLSPSYAEETVPAIVQRLKDGEGNDAVHGSLLAIVADALLVLPSKSESLFELILSSLRHPRVEVRKAAIVLSTAVLLKRLVKQQGKLALIAECYVDEEPEIRFHCHHFFHELVRLEKLDAAVGAFLSMEPENRRPVILNLLAIFSDHMEGDLSMMFVQSLIEESDADKAFVLSQLTPSAKSLAALQEALQRNLIDKDVDDIKESLIEHLRRALHKKGKEKVLATEMLKSLEGHKRTKRAEGHKYQKLAVTAEALQRFQKAPSADEQQLIDLSDFEKEMLPLPPPTPSLQSDGKRKPEAKADARVTYARPKRRR